MNVPRIVLVVVLLLVPAGLFVSAWQAYEYQRVSADIRRMEEQQRDLVEANKRMIIRLSQQESPQNILRRAKSELNMDWPRQDQLWTLRVKPTGEAGGNQ